MSKSKKQKTTTPATEKPSTQIARLATFIQNEIPGEPSASEGAIDTAIRLLRHSYGPEGLTVPDSAKAERLLG